MTNWNPTISAKEYSAGSIKVEVSYSKTGMDTFAERYTVSSLEDLQSLVKSKIAQLAQLDIQDALIPSNGTLVLPPDKTPTAFRVAEQKLYELKGLVELGVIKETDQEFIDAVTAYKTAK